MQAFLGPILSTIPVVGPIIAGLASIFGFLFGGIFGGSANDNLVKAFNGLRQSMIDMGNKLMKFAWTIAGWLGAIFNFLKWLWGNVLGSLVKAVRSIINQISRVLNKVLKPILDAMKAQRAALFDLWNRFIRPIIVAIQRIRSLIHLFQLLHIHIFDQLDRTLGKIQAKISAPFYSLLYRVNTLGNWISFILNLQGLLFRGLFLGSMNQNRGGSFSMLAGAPALGVTPITPAPVGALPAPVTPTYLSFDAAANTTLVNAAPVITTDPSASRLVPLLTAAPDPATAQLIANLQTALAADTGVTQV